MFVVIFTSGAALVFSIFYSAFFSRNCVYYYIEDLILPLWQQLKHTTYLLTYNIKPNTTTQNKQTQCFNANIKHILLLLLYFFIILFVFVTSKSSMASVL